MDFDVLLSQKIFFVTFVIIIIPSIICSLLIFYHFIRSQELWKRLNNHVILLLLLINFIQVTTDVPLVLVLLYTGSAPIQTSTFCLFWIVYDYALCVTDLMLMCYGCIERYFLVFHRGFFQKHLILLHYGPLLCCLTYPLLFYIGMVVIYPCENDFDYSGYICGGACYQNEPGPLLSEGIFNLSTPVVFGTIATVVIILRTIHQKRRVRQRAIWQRNRKMVLQLTSISLLYIVVWIPDIITYVISSIISDSPTVQFAANWFNYFSYTVSFLCPFMCLIGLPETRQFIQVMFIRANVVQPVTQNIALMARSLPQHQLKQMHGINNSSLPPSKRVQ